MSIVCAISGSLPEEPVLSKTGYIFERRLIEKHIEANGKCPVTGLDLDKSDLQHVNVPKTVKPRPVTASSIPGMLSLFQSEWDAIMSETFQLRAQLETVRNQLSHSLYQHDAATRVIARLLKERDTATQRINELQKQVAARIAEPGDEELGISEALMNEMQDLAKKLLASRKKRQIAGLASVEQIKLYRGAGQYPLHSSSTPGVLCVDVDTKTDSRIATGGMDAIVSVFDLNKQKTLSKLQGHLKKINDVKIHAQEHVILTASDDKTVRIWKGDDDDSQYKCAHTVRKHKGEVNSISLHPLNNYFVSSAQDKSWAFFELDSGRCILSNKDLACNYRCLSFHPDGMILGGGGDDGNIHIWDMKGAQFRVSLTGHTDAIVSLAFSENGYYLATASDDGSVKLWDLRKSISFQTIPMKESSAKRSVVFDHSGQYIAVASSDIVVYNFETRTAAAPVVTLSDHTAAVTGVCFGANANYLASSSMDRTVRLWEASSNH